MGAEGTGSKATIEQISGFYHFERFCDSAASAPSLAVSSEVRCPKKTVAVEPKSDAKPLIAPPKVVSTQHCGQAVKKGGSQVEEGQMFQTSTVSKINEQIPRC